MAAQFTRNLGEDLGFGEDLVAGTVALLTVILVDLLLTISYVSNDVHIIKNSKLQALC